MDPATFKQHTEHIVSHFYSSTDLDECRYALVHLDSPQHHPLFIKKLISSALDGTQKRCELASELLCHICPDIVSEDQIASGFMLLAHSVEDLTLDVPRAPQIIASFIARSVADRVLPSDFASNLVILDSKELGKQAHQVGLLAKAKLKLQQQPSRRRVAVQEIEDLRASVACILREFCECGNIQSSCHEVWALESPYFHHEVVKQLVHLAFESNPHVRVSLQRLFHALISSHTISKAQVTQGLERCLQRVESSPHEFVDDSEILAAFIQSASRCDAVESSLHERVHSALLSATAFCGSPPKATFLNQTAPADPPPDTAAVTGLQSALSAFSGLLGSQISTRECCSMLSCTPGAAQHFIPLCLRSYGDDLDRCTMIVDVLRMLVSERMCITAAEIESGLCHVLQREMHEPQHAHWISLCLARLVAVRVLSPVSISTLKAVCGDGIGGLARVALENAERAWRTLCAEGTGKRAPPRTGQGLRRAQHPASRGMEALEAEIQCIVSQLLDGSMELGAAARKLEGMNTPYMAPTVVLSVIQACSQREPTNAVAIGAQFIASLCASGTLTQTHLRQGIQRAVASGSVSPLSTTKLITVLLEEGSIAKSQLPQLPESISVDLSPFSSSCSSSQPSSPHAHELQSTEMSASGPLIGTEFKISIAMCKV